MSPSNMRNDHILTNAKSDCYTPAESFNASAISAEFPKRVNPFLKDVVSFDELNGNRDPYEEPVYNNNAKRASEPAIMSDSRGMIDEEDEGVNEEEEDPTGDDDDEQNFSGHDAMASQEMHGSHDDLVDEENNSSKLLHDSDVMENSFSTPSKHENIPDWVVVGESVQIRPYNTSGVIAFIGGTHFQGGTWIGVELDTPTGKNDGTVQGIQYFNCKPKHGIFVRVDKLILDKRGRAMRELKKAEKMKAELAGHKGKPVSANGPRK